MISLPNPSSSMTTKLMNRRELQDAYITEIIDGMDLKDCLALLHDFMDADLDKYSDQQLKEEVEEYYPHLLEDSTEASKVS
jgi:hypothetical protein